ncbi:hypothetical protein [Herbidospora galbida]|nr:hypothetical protein [Herbidospora galbida]
MIGYQDSNGTTALVSKRTVPSSILTTVTWVTHPDDIKFSADSSASSAK